MEKKTRKKAIKKEEMVKEKKIVKKESYPGISDLIQFFISCEQFTAMNDPPLQYIINFSKLEREFSTYLYQNGLLGDYSGVCEFCGKGEMLYVCDGHSPHHGRPIILWRCTYRLCRKKVSPRRGSIFENSRLSIRDIFVIIACYVYNIQQETIQLIYKFFASHTKVDWYNVCRDVCTEILLMDSEVIGGPKHVVEVDECKLGQRKYNHGLRIDGFWVFGGIDRETRQTFFQVVPECAPETLLPVLLENTKPGTTIATEYWDVYNDIKNASLKRRIAKHGLKFISPVAATVNITSKTSRSGLMKRRVRPKIGMPKQGYDGYFSMYCVRKKYLEGSVCRLSAFLDVIKLVYPLKRRSTAPSLDEGISATLENHFSSSTPTPSSQTPSSPTPSSPTPSSPTPRSPSPEPSRPHKKKRKIILTENGVFTNLTCVNTL